jgi:hypothetical protein
MCAGTRRCQWGRRTLSPRGVAYVRPARTGVPTPDARGAAAATLATGSVEATVHQYPLAPPSFHGCPSRALKGDRRRVAPAAALAGTTDPSSLREHLPRGAFQSSSCGEPSAMVRRSFTRQHRAQLTHPTRTVTYTETAAVPSTGSSVSRMARVGLLLSCLGDGAHRARSHPCGWTIDGGVVAAGSHGVIGTTVRVDHRDRVRGGVAGVAARVAGAAVSSA